MKKLMVAIAIITALSLLNVILPVGTAFIWFPNEIPLTTHMESDFSPAVMSDSNGNVWVVWHTYRTGNSDLYCKIHNGSAWSVPIQLTTHPAHDVNPAITQASDGTICLVWTSDKTGDYEVFYKNSSNNGLSWSAETRLTFNASFDRRPSVEQMQNGDIWVAWHSGRTGNDDIFYKVYNITAGTWSAISQLTNDTGADRGPSVKQMQDGEIWVVWGSYRTGNFDLFCKTYNGTSWSLETQLTTDSNWDQYPSILQTQDGKIWVFWQSDRKGTDYEIYYKFSTDNGASWSADTQFTSDGGEDTLPSVIQASNKTMWVAWSTNRLDDYEIFYRLASNEHDVGITSITASSTYVYKGYGITIDIEVRNYGLFSETFAVTAYYNDTIIDTHSVTNLASGGNETLVFQWTATGVASGNYILSSIAELIIDEDSSDNSFVNGMVDVRIPGDINGDRKVDVLDAILLTKHFGKPSGEFPAADINGDGIINLFDALILTIAFGETG